MGSSGRESDFTTNCARKTDARQKGALDPAEPCELENIGKRTKIIIN